MLRFTETGSDARPDYTDIAANFEAECDTDTYERKIAALLGRAYECGDKDVREAFRDACQVLRKEDRYILVMIDRLLGGNLRKKLFGIF